MSNDVVKLLQEQPNLNSKAILQAVLDCRQSFCLPTDPLPPRYLSSLWIAGVLSPTDILVVLIHQWNTSHRASKPISISEADIKSLQEFSLLLVSKLVINRTETRHCLLLSARWLVAIIQSMPQDTDSINSQIAEAVGSLLATLSATNLGIELLSEKKDGAKNRSDTVEGVRKAVELAIGAFPTLSVQLIERLGVVQKHIVMYDQTQPGQPGMQALQIQASVAEMPMTASRAGTILYIEAMVSISLSCRPTLTD
jgi:hypothetical protein